MKILVTGYACDPFRGSEPGVGWRAVCRIARKHDVCVITDIHNKAGWDRGALEGLVPDNVRARFIRKPNSTSENRWFAHLQSWRNCGVFNGLVLNAAKEWHEEERFDLCHQVTVAGWRMPSPLWRLPIPFIWGPIGGAGHIPPTFRNILSPSARLLELMRDGNTAWASRSKSFRDCIRETAVVFAANEETEDFLRPYREGRPMVRLPIASIPPEAVERFSRHVVNPSPSGPLRLFAGGNMEGRKGLGLALEALALARKKGLDFQYTIGGGGPEIPRMIRLSERLCLDDVVEFHPGFQNEGYVRALHEADVYFLPSFRESTPVTLLEACLAGCLPVVADTSAQGEIVRLVGGKAVSVLNHASLVEGLAEALLWCASHRDEVRQIANGAAAKVAECFSSARYDRAIDHAYSEAMTLKSIQPVKF